jgi:hypothetical protein
LNDSGLETQQGQRYVFSKSTRPALGPTQPPMPWVAGSLPGLKRPGRDVHHSPPSTAEVNTLCIHSWRGQRQVYLFLNWGGGGRRVVIRIVKPRHYVNPFVLVLRIFSLFLLQFNSGWFQHVLGNFSIWMSLDENNFI